MPTDRVPAVVFQWSDDEMRSDPGVDGVRRRPRRGELTDKVTESAGKLDQRAARARGSGAWLLVAMAWSLVASACAAGVVFRPWGLVPPWVVIPVWIGLAGWFWIGSRRFSVRRVTTDWAASLVGFSAVGVATLNAIWSPGLIWVLFWLGSVGLGIAALITGLARVWPSRERRHVRDLTIALGFCAVLFVVDVPLLGPLAELGTEARLRVMAERYEAEAEALFASPPPRSYSLTDPDVGRGEDGRPVVVAWIWSQGLAVQGSSGVAYDPEGQLDNGEKMSELTFNYVVPYECEPLFDDWHSCTFD
jgi:hypothetical protein